MKTDSLQAAEWYLDFQLLACERLLDIELQKINESFTINSHEKVLAFLLSSNWLWNCMGIICGESRHFPSA
jgi:hypothetical protein